MADALKDPFMSLNDMMGSFRAFGLRLESALHDTECDSVLPGFGRAPSLNHCDARVVPW